MRRRMCSDIFSSLFILLQNIIGIEMILKKFKDISCGVRMLMEEK